MPTQVEIEHLARALHEAQVEFYDIGDTWGNLPAEQQSYLKQQARYLLEKFM